MATHPWTSHHALDAAGVAALVAEQFPDLAPVRAAYLDEGWDSVVYEVAGEWIFRFPKRAEVQASQDVERALLPRLAPRLPIAVPRPSRFGSPTADYPFRFLGYRKLPGTPAILLPLDAVDVDECGAQMAALLTAVHGFPAEEARSLGVPECRDPTSFDRWRDHFLPRLATMAAAMSAALVERARAFLASPSPRAAREEVRLIHYDVGDAHVLVDVGERRVSGLIDWGDVCLGDPALDFAGLLQWLGEPVVTQALATYHGAPLDEGFLDRVRAGAAYASFSALWYGLEADRPEHVRSGLRSLDHSLPRP